MSIDTRPGFGRTQCFVVRCGTAISRRRGREVVTHPELLPRHSQPESGWFSLSFRLRRGLDLLSLSSGVGRLIVNHRGCWSFPRPDRVRAPSLRRRYPASTVLRTHPPSAVAGAGPHGFAVEVEMPLHPTSADFPCCAPMFCHACCHLYPGETVRCVSRSLVRRRRPPHSTGGSALTANLFEASSMFAVAAARMAR